MEPLVHIPELVQHDVHLQYIDTEASAIDDWIKDAQGASAKDYLVSDAPASGPDLSDVIFASGVFCAS